MPKDAGGGDRPRTSRLPDPVRPPYVAAGSTRCGAPLVMSVPM